MAAPLSQRFARGSLFRAFSGASGPLPGFHIGSVARSRPKSVGTGASLASDLRGDHTPPTATTKEQAINAVLSPPEVSVCVPARINRPRQSRRMPRWHRRLAGDFVDSAPRSVVLRSRGNVVTGHFCKHCLP
ncbi:MAG TPA: hypothetical protein VEG38_01510 [Acidimicrobiia bacterium]|nr:hypothetical protein [Acidimicrobiia bacterium]